MKNSTKTKKINLRQVAFTRFMLVVAFFVLWIGGIGVRLVNLQVTQHAWLKEKAVDMRQNLKQTRMLRGTIFDRDERALAMSIHAKTLYADPTEIPDVNAAAKSISKALKMQFDEVLEQLTEGKEAGKRYIILSKKLEEEAVSKINSALESSDIKKADLPRFAGLHWKEDQKRSYPYKTLASQIIGFSNADDDGKAGIEQSQDEILHGAVIKKLQERDRLGRVYDETVFEREAPGDVILTLNSKFQYIAEQALERGVYNAQAKSGMAVVMDPRTGEILAIANYPTFDPNSITGNASENISNKAIQSSYSPGSVFKIVTYSSGLEKKLFRPDDQIDAGDGSIEVANHTFTDSHHVGRVTYAEALAHSSNVCAIKTGLSVGKDAFYSTLKGFGFGGKTGIELPAETGGIVRAPDRWNGDSLASMSIGYEIGVSALQMASAFATIANDGVRVQPHIIKEIRRSDERPVKTTEPDKKQVVSAETARNLRIMLRQVVLTGTGRRAQLNGYTCAGKTGTAWKVNTKSKTVDSSKYVSSFIGMAPYDRPEIVVAVVMDEPKVGARDGGMVSAPVFREIAQQILQEMKVAPDIAIKEESLMAATVPESPKSVVVISAKSGEKEKKESRLPAKSGNAPAGSRKPLPTKKTTEKLGKANACWKREFDFGLGPPWAYTRLET